MITSDAVKELRDRTGISVMQCKVALEEAGGDIEKAVMLLRKKGSAIADKRGDRSLGAGVLSAYVHANKKVAAVVELQSETDFVAKNEEFVKLAYELAMQVTAIDPEDVPALLEQTYIKDNTMTVKQLIDNAIQKFGERIEVGAIKRFTTK